MRSLRELDQNRLTTSLSSKSTSVTGQHRESNQDMNTLAPGATGRKIIGIDIRLGGAICRGIVEGFLGSLSISTTFITPSCWKKAVGLRPIPTTS
jgi:hypothetical protein